MQSIAEQHGNLVATANVTGPDTGSTAPRLTWREGSAHGFNLPQGDRPGQL